jgi:acyl-CoA thioesterase-2
MGDLAEQTAVEDLGGGRFRSTLSQDWEIWGPMGGYVAAHALRAVGATTPHAHPAAFSCHYLGVARFEEVDLLVEPRKEGRAASSHRVAITQGGTPILDAMVWSTARGDGLEHDETVPPDVPGPDGLKSIGELLPPDAAPPFRFWENLDAKPLAFEADWPPDGPRAARWQEWLRFLPTATWDDEWVDACRSVILVDLPSWPSAHRPHAWKQEPWMAPTLDLNVAFHRSARGESWLLCDGSAPVSTGGLFGWTARVWSPGRELLASGGGQCLYRRMRSG